MAKATKRPDARQMAVDAVKDWYDAMTYSADAHTDGHIHQVTLGDAFSEVTKVLEAEWRAAHGPHDDAEEESIVGQMLAREAGYLIGVQVGLRLRMAQ